MNEPGVPTGEKVFLIADCSGVKDGQESIIDEGRELDR